MEAKRIHDSFRVDLLKPNTEDAFQIYAGEPQIVQFSEGRVEHEGGIFINHGKQREKHLYRNW